MSLLIVYGGRLAGSEAAQFARRQLLHVPVLTLAGLLLQSDPVSAGACPLPHDYF